MQLTYLLTYWVSTIVFMKRNLERCEEKGLKNMCSSEHGFL